jgi:hypothetical protein
MPLDMHTMSTVNVTVTAMLGIVLVFTRARERGTVAASRRTRERSGVSIEACATSHHWIAKLDVTSATPMASRSPARGWTRRLPGSRPQLESRAPSPTNRQTGTREHKIDPLAVVEQLWTRSTLKPTTSSARQ